MEQLQVHMKVDRSNEENILKREHNRMIYETTTTKLVKQALYKELQFLTYSRSKNVTKKSAKITLKCRSELRNKQTNK